MFSKDILRGILLSVARHNLTIYVNEKAKLGYSIKFAMEIRGDIEFLKAIQRTLIQHKVSSSLKQKESSTRKQPLLRIIGIFNLSIIAELLPDLPNYRNDLKEFKKIVNIINENKHKTLEGLELLMKIKGVL